jgi:hypothetical protein
MDPAVTGFEAFLTAFGVRADVLNLVEVGAFGGHTA